MAYPQNITQIIEETNRISHSFSNAQLWFRGQNSYKWDLVPSAFRRNPILESEVYNLFRIKAPGLTEKCPDHKDYKKWITFMQHYGIPTRLLDWTESLSTALFFALENNASDDDAIIYCLSPGHLNQTSGLTFIPTIDNELVDKIVIEGFSSFKENALILALLAPYYDPRMNNQQSCYTITGTRTPLNLIPNKEDFLEKIIIKKEYWGTIRNELSILGIKRSLIYPDIQNLANELNQLNVIA